MPRYSTKTRKAPEQVVEEAKAYFGEEGVGLELSSDNTCCVTFTGGGGHVTVTASGGSGQTEVELETREWDYHVKKFLRRV